MTKEKTALIKEMQDELFHLNGKGWFRIISGSMQPLIDINDRVLVKKIAPSEVKMRDIILFKSNDAFVAHRVIKLEKHNGKTMILQKGDEGVHAGLIAPESIIGKVMTIEKRGRFLDLESGQGRVINSFLGFKNYIFYRLDRRIYRIKQMLRDKPCFTHVRAMYRLFKKPLSFLNRMLVRILLYRLF
jgi:signal peptidase I